MEPDSKPAGAVKFIRSRGLKFPNDPGALSRRTRIALKSDSYETRESEAVLKLIKPGDTVLELGAGIGYMSTLIARKTGAREIHSFEANPHLIPYIARVHAANDVTNAHVTNAILGPRKGTAPFYVRKNFLASSLDRMDGTDVVSQERIEVVNMNRTIDRIRPDILVCDIEGAETSVIPAMKLDGLRGAVIELHPQWIGPNGVRAVFAAMMQAGLVYYPRWSNAKVVCFRKDW